MPPPPPPPPPRRAALAVLSPNNHGALTSRDAEAPKLRARTAGRQTLSVAAAEQQMGDGEGGVLWRGWLRKQSGAKQSGKTSMTMGSVLRKWDQRYFTVRRSGQCTAWLEWHRTDNIAGQPQHSFQLVAGALLRPVEGQSEDRELLLPPEDPHGKSHRVTLKPEGDFASFTAVLASCGVAVQGAAGPPMPPQAAEASAHNAQELQLPGERARFVQAAATSLRRLHMRRSPELRFALERLMAAAANAGVVVKSSQATLTAPADGSKLGLRLESCPDEELGVQVRDVVDGGLAANENVEAGMILKELNGVSVNGWAISDIEASLRSTPRPFTLTFSDLVLSSGPAPAGPAQQGLPIPVQRRARDSDMDSDEEAHANRRRQHQRGGAGLVGQSDDDSSSESSSSSSSSSDSDDDEADEHDVPPKVGHKRSIYSALATDANGVDNPRRNAMVIHESGAEPSETDGPLLSRRQQLEQQLAQQRSAQRQRAATQSSQRSSFSSAVSVSSTGSSSSRSHSLRSSSSQSSKSLSPGAHAEEPLARAAKLQRRREERRGRIQQSQQIMQSGLTVTTRTDCTTVEERFEV
jgi:hypothetical protein